MELKGENRIIVKEGIRRLRTTQNPGLKALIEVNGLEYDKLSAYHMGFIIGPCLNATGRLDTALRALELLESTTKAEAMSAASELKALNDSRKDLTLKGVEQAISHIEERGKAKAPVMVIYLPEVHESLAGIIAGRIREIYHRPVFVLTKSEEGVKGSGRSIETYHMYDNLTAVKHCFTKFGGHKLAAGLTLAARHATLEEDVEAFAGELNQLCTLTEDDFIPRVHIDVPMPMSYATKEIAKELEQFKPMFFEEPTPPDNLEALKAGMVNLDKHLRNLQSFGQTVVVVFNKYNGDTDEEMDYVRQHCAELGVGCEVNDAYALGGEGAAKLAQLVVDTINEKPSSNLQFAYDDTDSVEDKIAKVAKNLYGAASVTLSAAAKKKLAMIAELGYTHFPICIAKTQYSFSTDAKKYGAPEGFGFNVQDIVINAGAEMLVVVSGDIMRMPGLPKEPAALHIDIVNGQIEGLD